MTSMAQSADVVDGVAAARRRVDPHPDTDDQRLDAALVDSTSDTEVAVFAPPRAPRVGAQLSHTRMHTHD